MTQEFTPPESEKVDFREDIFRNFAFRILKGEIGEFCYCLENDQTYEYKEGYWKSIREMEFLSKIENGILNKKGFKIVTRFPVEKREKIIKNYKLLAYKKLEDFNKVHLLNFENCMFNPITLEREEHKKEYYSTIRIPYEYDTDHKCELWIKTLNEIFENDQIKINSLQEFFGQCLTRDIKQEKGLLLLGESRSGKSTILNTLHNMIGIKNCSTVPLKYILNPVYTSQMIGKLINFDKDVSKKAQDFEEDFKKIVTGEEITSNDKYEHPFDFRPFCKMVLSANEFPKITDHSSAFYNRLVLIPCERVFKPSERNINLREELISELPGILNWSIEGLKRLNERGRFEEVNFMKEAIEELENENNPCNVFFNDHVEIAMGDFTTKGDLYDKYKYWSEKTKNYQLSENKFSTIVYKKYHAQTPKHARLENSGKRIWRNIKYVDYKMEAPQPENYRVQDEIW